MSRRAAAPHAQPAALIVAAHCASGAGSPPSGVFVLSRRESALVITATLVAASQEVQVDVVSATGSLVRVEGSTYSRPDVPRCCPDVPFTRSWTLVGGRARPTPS